MPEINDIPATANRLSTIDEINAGHDRLVERFHSDDGDDRARCAEAIAFMAQIAAAGARLYSDSERSSAQSLLSYWSNLLYRHDVPPAQLEGELAAYDPEAGDDLTRAEYPFAPPEVLDDAAPGQQRAWSRLLNDALAVLRTNRLLVIIGAPGSGRSFLLGQALWPRLARRGVALDDAEAAPLRCLGVLVASVHPLEDLVAVLAPTDDPRELAARVLRLREAPTVFIGEVAPPSRGAVLAVDQIEELFAFASEQDVTAFLRAIAAWVDKGQTAIVVGDSDALTRLAGREEFTKRLNDAQLNVTFDANELREIVEEPARRVGLIFEEGIVERLLRDVQGDPAALALLQFTLQRLWQERGGRRRNRISFETYRQLGGGWVALQRAAERVYRLPGADRRDAIKWLFTTMLTPHLGSGFSVTPVPINPAGKDAPPQERLGEIVVEFCEAGLLRVIEPVGSEPRKVTVSHPALVRHWPRIVEWLDEKRVQMRGRLMLHNVSEQWRECGDASLLWRGSLLAEALTYPRINPSEQQFLLASQHARRRRIWIKRAVLTTIIGLLAALSFGMWQRSRIAHRHTLVVARDAGEKAFALARTTVKEGTQSIAKGDMSMAALWFAGSLGEVERAVDEMRGHGVEIEPADLARCAAHRQRLSIALRQIPRLAHYAVHPRLAATDGAADGERVVTASYTVGNESGVARLWDPAGKSTLLASNTGLPANAVAFRRDGWLVAVGFGAIDGKAGAVQIWEAGSGAKAGGVETAGAVRNLVFSPAHDRVAFWVATPGREGGEVTVWDRATGEIWAQPIETGVNRIAFNPEADRVAIALGDARKRAPGGAMIWAFAAPRGEAAAPLRIAHEATVNWVDFSLDGAMLVTASGFPEDDAVGEARVWDAGTGAPLTVPLRHARKVAMAGFSPEGRRVVTASNDSTARVWDVRSGRALLALPHDGWVYQASFSPDGRHVLTGSRDRCARVWDLATGRLLLPPLRHEGSVVHAAFADDGRRVVIGGGDAVRVWDLVTAMRPAPEFEHAVSAAAFSADGERILTAAEPDKQGSSYVQIIQDDGEKIKPRLPMPGPVKYVAISADGKRIAAAGGPGANAAEARVWKVGSEDGVGKPLKPGGEITGLAMAPPDGRRLLVISRTADLQPRRVTLWEPETGKATPLEHAYAVVFVAFSPDGAFAVTGSGDSIAHKGAARIYDAATGELRGELPHTEAVTFASFDKKKQRLATGGIDDAAVVWDVSKVPFRQIVRIEKVHSADLTIAKFSTDGQTLLTAGYDSTAVLYDLARWVRDGTGPTTRLPHGGVVVDAAFSPDDSHVITASADRTARIWDARTGDLIAVLPHQAEVRSAAFDAEGKRAFTLSFASVRPKYVAAATGGANSAATRLRLEEARIWDLAQSNVPTDDLRAGAQFMAAGTVAGGTLGPAALKESDEQWQRMRADYLAQVPRLSSRIHHLREATFCEAGERWFAAAWHLEAAIRATEGEPDRRILKRCGEAFSSCDRWAEAEHYYDWTLLSLPPDDKLWAPTIYMRARMRTELHRWDEAIADCKLMQQQDPKDHESWTVLGTIHLEQAQDCARHGRTEEEARHWQECLKAMSKAGELAADDAGPLQRLAALKLKLSPNDNPAPYLQACEELWTKFHQDARQAARISWPFALDPRSNLDRLRELLPDVEKAAEANPTYFRLNTLGAVYFRTEQYDKALETLDRSRKVWAEVQVRESLAQVNDEAASSAMAELEDGRPQDQVFLAMVHYQLSRGTHLAGDAGEQHAAEAQRWLRKALDSYDQIQQGKSREPGAPRRLWNELEFGMLLNEASRMIGRPKISAIDP